MNWSGNGVRGTGIGRGIAIDDVGDTGDLLDGPFDKDIASSVTQRRNDMLTSALDRLSQE